MILLETTFYGIMGYIYRTTNDAESLYIENFKESFNFWVIVRLILLNLLKIWYSIEQFY